MAIIAILHCGLTSGLAMLFSFQLFIIPNFAHGMEMFFRIVVIIIVTLLLQCPCVRACVRADWNDYTCMVFAKLLKIKNGELERVIEKYI